jgi:hypothetical protein
MFRVGFEPTIPVFERAKTFHALDCIATVIGRCTLTLAKIITQRSFLTSRVICHRINFKSILYPDGKWAYLKPRESSFLEVKI